MSDRVSKREFFLMAIVVCIMVVVLFISGLFYFSLIAGSSSINAKVVYGISNNNSAVQNSSLNSSNSTFVQTNQSAQYNKTFLFNQSPPNPR